MKDLTEFLLDRIAEDEYEANVCLDQYRRGEGGSTPRWVRQLAECEAKRRIVELHYPVDPCDAHDANLRSIPCDTLLALAQPYADHPDYREEWRP